jgi:serine/threonine-protein kinase
MIGSGGMGQVWRAEHIKLRSPVAIKVLPDSVTSDETRSARFMREAQAAAAIRSTNVVQVLDYGVDDGVAYIAMELLEGESLESRLARRGRLTPQETLRILIQVGKAVGRAHKRGIVHRDLKPANIFMAREDEGEVVKVLDFGIAKLTTREAPARQVTAGGGDTSADSNTTQAGFLLGTPNYMSPEQARGHEVVDHRTDLWALGIVAFECLTGTHPVEGATVGDLIYKICSEDMPRPSKICPVPLGFDAWFAKASRRNPAERYQTARQLVRGLREALTGDPSSPDDEHKEAQFDKEGEQRASIEMLDTLAAKRQSEKPRESSDSWDTSDELPVPSGPGAAALVTPHEVPAPALSEDARSGTDGESLRAAGGLSRTATSSTRPPGVKGWWLLGALVLAAGVTTIVLVARDEPHAAPAPAGSLPSAPPPREPLTPSATSPSAVAPPATTPAPQAAAPAPSASASATPRPRAKVPPKPVPAPSGSGKIDFGI